MSITTVVAHLGVFRVRCTSMSRGSSRSGRAAPADSPACRSIALTSDPGMSMWATESPNS